jgi:hypothetical protein
MLLPPPTLLPTTICCISRCTNADHPADLQLMLHNLNSRCVGSALMLGWVSGTEHHAVSRCQCLAQAGIKSVSNLPKTLRSDRPPSTFPVPVPANQLAFLSNHSFSNQHEHRLSFRSHFCRCRFCPYLHGQEQLCLYSLVSIFCPSSNNILNADYFF